MGLELKKGVFLTLKYFNLFDYPLKKEEIWQWLWRAVCDRREFEEVLEQTEQQGLIMKTEGYYFLPGRKEIIALRRERELISLLKIKKAQRMAKILALIPAVRLIAVCSNLGYLNADDGADIDFFIVAKKGRIWSARFWSVAIMKILGQRPNKKTIKNKVCLSYFVSEDNLNLKNTAISETDTHLVYLLSQYLPIYSEDNWWPRFVRANEWIKNYLPNFSYEPRAERFLIKPKFLWLKKIIDKAQFKRGEAWYKKIQLKILPSVLKEAMGRADKKVIINDRILKLHSNDKREEVNHKISKIQDTIFK